MATVIEPKMALNLLIEAEDAGGPMTLREYLKELLRTVWREEEGFSGKRPFGNSGWQYQLAADLMKAGVPVGTLDEDGYIGDVDHKVFDALIYACIDLL